MSTEKHKGERIAKRIARAGLCSRRDAEGWVSQGRVRVNGVVIESAALNVVDSDVVLVDGKALPDKEPPRLFLYHKPVGLVTSHKDERGRETVFSALPPDLPRVVSVGRLDLNTEGLLLLTNDGELARFLELPAHAWKRRYRVRVHGKVDEKRLESLKKGIKIDGVVYQSIEAKIDEVEKSGANSWLSVVLKEGKNREIRRVMEALGLQVTRLIRTDYGPFTLGRMERGAVAEVAPKVLQDQVAGYFKQAGITLDTTRMAGVRVDEIPRKKQGSGNSGEKIAKKPAGRPAGKAAQKYAEQGGRPRPHKKKPDSRKPGRRER